MLPCLLGQLLVIINFWGTVHHNDREGVAYLRQWEDGLFGDFVVVQRVEDDYRPGFHERAEGVYGENAAGEEASRWETGADGLLGGS